jgi:hypothetical protein
VALPGASEQGSASTLATVDRGSADLPGLRVFVSRVFAGPRPADIDRLRVKVEHCGQRGRFTLPRVVT